MTSLPRQPLTFVFVRVVSVVLCAAALVTQIAASQADLRNLDRLTARKATKAEVRTQGNANGVQPRRT
jgi:hypothetical protein